MILTINGKEKSIEVKTVKNLLDKLDLNEKVMAVAVNMDVIKKEEWISFELAQNDKVELLQFVGGG